MYGEEGKRRQAGSIRNRMEIAIRQSNQTFILRR
jgi:hypothetical protein